MTITFTRSLSMINERYYQVREAAGRNGIGALPAADRWEVLRTPTETIGNFSAFVDEMGN